MTSRFRTWAPGSRSRSASSTAWAARMCPAPTEAESTRMRLDAAGSSGVMRASFRPGPGWRRERWIDVGERDRARESREGAAFGDLARGLQETGPRAPRECAADADAAHAGGGQLLDGGEVAADQDVHGFRRD